MQLLTIYLALAFISFLYIIKDNKIVKVEVAKQVPFWINEALFYYVFILCGTLSLMGIWWVISDGRKFFRVFFWVLLAKFTIWKIKRKNNLK